MNETQDAQQEKLNRMAQRYFGKDWSHLGWSARDILKRSAAHAPISRDPREAPSEQLSLGDRIADKVAQFGGSWRFIFICLSILAIWVLVNGVWLGSARAFDPYPFILLNLFLSMIAALQAPVIMMSQNRLSQKDREAAAHDYEVNLKAEIEIMALHDKLEQLRAQDLKLILERIEGLAGQISRA